MIKKIFSLTLLICFIFSTSKAEIVKDVAIEGNKRISKETIMVYGEIQINKDFSERDINKVINNLYSTDFFQNLDVRLENNILKINVLEYPRINKLIVIGEKKKKNVEQLKDLIRLKENQSFIKSYLAKDIEIIKQLYSSLGFNFTIVEAKVKKIDNNNLDLLVEIKRGEKTIIS